MANKRKVCFRDCTRFFRRRIHGDQGRCLVFILWLTMATATVHAQTADDALRFAERSPAAGARMIGMAGAGIAGVADFSALYANPAGLGYLQSSEAVGSFNVLRAVDEARYEVLPLDEEAAPSVATGTQRASSSGLGNAGLAYKMPTQRGSLVLAGGINQTSTFERSLDYVGANNANSITDTFLPFLGNFLPEIGAGECSRDDLAFDFDTPLRAYNAGAIEFVEAACEEGTYPFIQAVAPGTTIQQAEEVTEEGRMTEANFGGAVEAAPGVMMGASLNISYGTYRFTRLYQEIDIEGENIPELYQVETGNGGLLEGFDQLDLEERVTSELVGVNLRGGISAEVSPNIRAGLVIESPTWYAVDETFGTRITTFFDRPAGSMLDDGELDANEFDYTVRTPWRLGGGAAVLLGRIHVTGDLEFVDWTQLRLRADDADFSAANRRIRDFEAVINGRLGVEYRLDALTLRGGFAYQPDPRDVEIELSGGETTDRTKTFYSAGFSYWFSDQFRIDVGWLHERFDDQYRPYASIEVPGEFDEEGEPVDIVAPFIDEEIIRNRFLVGITYAF